MTPSKFTSVFHISAARIVLAMLFLGVSLFLYAPTCEGGLTGFEATGSMTQPRTSHTANLLPNGKVLVTGPFNAELYDPGSRTFAPTGGLNQSHVNHTATLLANGKVLVAGGISGAFYETRSAELFDPATGIWTQTGNLKFGR